jgi:sarcosine oxidase subunit beta
VQQAAAVGRVLAEEVVDGRARSIDIEPLRYERFERGRKVQEQNIV